MSKNKTGENMSNAITISPVTKWHPLHSWHLLRLNKSYQAAVDEYKKSIDNDKKQKEVFDYFSQSDNDPFIDSLSDEDQVYKDTMSIYERNFSEVGRSRYSIELLNNDFCVKNTAYLNFIKKFGDVVLYPIDYNTIFPKRENFETVWMFAPVLLVTNDILTFRKKIENELQENSPFLKTSSINFMVNYSFAQSLITEEAENYIKRKIQRSSDFESEFDFGDLDCRIGGPKHKDRFDDFDLTLKAFELSKTKMTWKEIGEKLYRSKLAVNNHSAPQFKKKVEDSIQKVKRMLKYFDR